MKKLLRRRSAVEPVIGHVKNEHRMGRNYLHGRHGDAANAILAAVGYNFRLLPVWLGTILRVLLAEPSDHATPVAGRQYQRGWRGSP